MKNVTITLDEEVARWARVRAAESNTSVSRLVGELLRQHMKEEQAYDAAMKRYLRRKPRMLKKRGETYPAREELHDRARVR
jgi:plasmid stability protein